MGLCNKEKADSSYTWAPIPLLYDLLAVKASKHTHENKAIVFYCLNTFTFGAILKKFRAAFVIILTINYTYNIFLQTNSRTSVVQAMIDICPSNIV